MGASAAMLVPCSVISSSQATSVALQMAVQAAEEAARGETAETAADIASTPSGMVDRAGLKQGMDGTTAVWVFCSLPAAAAANKKIQPSKWLLLSSAAARALGQGRGWVAAF